MKKLILNEQQFTKTLNEVFSPSMPQWLEDRFRFIDYMDAIDYGFDLKLRNKKKQKLDKLSATGHNVKQHSFKDNPMGQHKPTYNIHSVGNPSLHARLTQFSHLTPVNIALDTANFISGPVPTSSYDPRLKSPNIPIFHLVVAKGHPLYSDYGYVNTVYIKGVNDDEKIGYNDTLLKYFSIKQLLEITQDFCYLDGTDPKNFSKDVRLERDDLRRELNEVPNYYRKFRAAGNTVFSSRFDKSGYEVLNPKRYEKKLAEIHANDYANKLNLLYNQIVSLKNELSYVLADLSLSDMSTGLLNSIVKNVFDVIKRYNELTETIEKITRLTALQDQKDTIQAAWKTMGVALEKNLKAAQSEIQKYQSVEIDWDTDDYIEEI